MTAVRPENNLIQQIAPGQQAKPNEQKDSRDASLAAFEGHLEKALQVGSDLDSRNMNAAVPLMDDIKDRSMNDSDSLADKDDAAAQEARDAEESQNDADDDQDNGRDDDADRDDQNSDDDSDASSEDGASETAEAADGSGEGSQNAAFLNSGALNILTPEKQINVSAITGQPLTKDPEAVLLETGLVEPTDAQQAQLLAGQAGQGQQAQNIAADSDGDAIEGLNFNNVNQQMAGAQATAAQGQSQNQAQGMNGKSEKIDPVQMVLNNGTQATQAAHVTGQATTAQAQTGAAQQAMNAQVGETMTQADFLLQKQESAATATGAGGKSFLDSLGGGKDNPALQAAQRNASLEAQPQPPHANAGPSTSAQAQPITAENLARSAPQPATSASALNAASSTPQTPQAQVVSQPQAPQGTQQTQGTVATQQTQNPQGTQQARATEQIAMTIRKNVASGNDTITVRLDPPELGRVDVKLTLSAEGGVTAKIMANNQDTLDMLKRDSRELERALRDAGLDANSENMEFELNKDESSSGFANNARDHEDAKSGRAANTNTDTEDMTDEDALADASEGDEDGDEVRTSDHALDIVA